MIRFIVAGACAIGLLAAQSTPCVSANDATNTVGMSVSAFPFSGPNNFAYRITPATAVVLQSAQLYTASSLSTSGYMTLEIYDESGAGLPGNRLAGGTLQTSNALGLGWWGASFDGLAVLQAATNYWLVWREAGGARLPYEPGGTTVPWARFTGGNWVLQTTQQPLKWRGFCSLLDGQGRTPIGFACGASTGKVPAAFANYAPTVGNAGFQFEATGFANGAIALAVIGANPSWSPFAVPGAPSGCDLNVDPMVVATLTVGSGNQQASHTVGAAGHCFFDLPIPANPALVGFAVDAQFAGFDAGAAAALPFVFTNALRATIY
jgi:hypothetical protein